MRMVSALCLAAALWAPEPGARALVRSSALRGASTPAPTKCPCRAANFTALLTNGSLPVTHAMLYPTSETPEAVFDFPANYGSSCKAWDEEAHPACKDKHHAPSWCQAEWCYVDPTCVEETTHEDSDVRQTVQFGKQELFYSYAACGAVDTATPEHCLMRDKAACMETASCAWQAAQELCQSALCQCQHTELPASANGTANFAADYGSTCGAWDHDRCRAFGENEDESMGKSADESLGLWCCMSFCFVEASCPSATKHPALPDKYISYVACPSDAAELQECPAGLKAVDAHGDPLPISSAVSHALEQKMVEAQKELKAKVEPRPLHEMYKDEETKAPPAAATSKP